MPRTVKGSPPRYRHHKPTDQAVVTIDGRDFYLGKHETLASRSEYDRLIAEWLANGRRLPSGTGGSVDSTVNELILAFWRHAQTYYRKPDGTPTGELENIRKALRPLRQLHGHTSACEFGPLALKAVRQSMIEAGWSRGWINKNVDRIKRMFRWATENEMVPTDVYHGLRSVAGLRRGRSEAKETDPVRPVPDSHIDAIQPHAAPQIWTMVELQRLSGMRPGEVVRLRTSDLNTENSVWTYTPGTHKTEHHGYTRTVYLGPRAQAALRPWLREQLDAYLFQPREVVADRRARRQARRKTPMSCGNKPGSNRKRRPKRTPGERYTVNSYRQAVRKVCEKASIPPWSPGRLRHNAGTDIRREAGIEMARIILGHRSAVTSEIYAEADKEKAAALVARIG